MLYIIIEVFQRSSFFTSSINSSFTFLSHTLLLCIFVLNTHSLKSLVLSASLLSSISNFNTSQWLTASTSSLWQPLLLQHWLFHSTMGSGIQMYKMLQHLAPMISLAFRISQPQPTLSTLLCLLRPASTPSLFQPRPKRFQFQPKSFQQ